MQQDYTSFVRLGLWNWATDCLKLLYLLFFLGCCSSLIHIFFLRILVGVGLGRTRVLNERRKSIQFEQFLISERLDPCFRFLLKSLSVIVRYHLFLSLSLPVRRILSKFVGGK